MRKKLFALIILLASSHFSVAQIVEESPAFPVEATLLVGDQFGGSEGIAFNGEGRLFVTGVASSMPTSAVSSAEKMNGVVFSIRPSATF